MVQIIFRAMRIIIPMKEKLHSFGAVFVSAALLIAAKAAAALGKIPLCSVLGAENSGLYYAVFPLIGIFVSLSSGGITACVSAAEAAFSSEGKTLSPAAVKRVTVFTFGIAAAAASAAAVLAGFVAAAQNIPGAAVLYRAAAPAIIFSAISSVFKGWLLGNKKFVPVAANELLLQIIKSAAGVGGAMLFSGCGGAAPAIAASAAVSLGECAALAALVPRYLHERRAALSARGDTSGKSGGSSAAKSIILKSIPLSAGGLIAPLCCLIESFIVLRLTAGAAAPAAEYGIKEGAVGSLLSLPAAVFHAMSSYFLPLLSEKNRKCSFPAAFSVFVSAGIIFSATYAIMPDSIIAALFPSLSKEFAEKAAFLLAAGASGCLFGAITHAYATFFHAKGKTWQSTAVRSFAAALRITLAAALVPSLGIKGATLAQVIAAAASAAALIFLSLRTGAELKPVRTAVIMPCSAMYCAFLAVFHRICAPLPAFAGVALSHLCAAICVASLCAVVFLTRRYAAKRRES